MKQIRSQQSLVERDSYIENSAQDFSNNNFAEVTQLYIDQDDRVQNVTYDDIVWQFISEMSSDDEGETKR